LRSRFRTTKLKRLYTEGHNPKHYPERVVEAFLDVMLVIESASDEGDFYHFPSLHFEKLKGARKGQRSLVLADGYRLVFTLERDDNGKYLYILEIKDYHGRVRGGEL